MKESLKNARILLPRFRNYDSVVAKIVDLAEPEKLEVASTGGLDLDLTIDLDVAKRAKNMSGLFQGSKLLDIAKSGSYPTVANFEITNDEGAGVRVNFLRLEVAHEEFERRQPGSVSSAIKAFAKHIPENSVLARVFKAGLPEILASKEFRKDPRMAAAKDTIRYLYRNIVSVIVGNSRTFAVGRYPDDYRDKSKAGKYFLYMNPKFVFQAAAESLSSVEDTLVYILAHEALHIRLGHLDKESYAGSRISVKNPQLDNLIFDAIINAKVSEWLGFSGPVDHGVWTSDPVKYTLYYGLDENGNLRVSTASFPGSATRIISVPGGPNNKEAYRSFFMVFMAALVHIIRDFVEDFASSKKDKKKEKSGSQGQQSGDSSQGGESGEPGESGESGEQEGSQAGGGAQSGDDQGSQDSGSQSSSGGSQSGEEGQESGDEQSGDGQDSQSGGEQEAGGASSGGQSGGDQEDEPNLPSGGSGELDSPDLSDIFGEDDSPNTGKTGVFDDHSEHASSESEAGDGSSDGDSESAEDSGDSTGSSGKEGKDPEADAEDVMGEDEVRDVRDAVEKATHDTPESEEDGDDYLEKDADKKVSEQVSQAQAKARPSAMASGTKYSPEEIEAAIIPPEKADLDLPSGDDEDDDDGGKVIDHTLDRIIRKIVPYYLTEYTRVRVTDMPSRKVQGLWGASMTKKGINEDSILILVDVSTSINLSFAARYIVRTIRLVRKVAPNVKNVWILFHSDRQTYKRYPIASLGSYKKVYDLLIRARGLVGGGNGSESVLGHTISRIAKQVYKRGEVKLALWFTDLQYSIRDDRKAWTIAPFAIIDPSGALDAGSTKRILSKYRTFGYETMTARGGGKVSFIGRMLRITDPAIAAFLRKYK